MICIPHDCFDVVVVGAGHAGCEAALAVARLGVICCLVTLNIERLGVLSCNPAIGGLAKGHLVREIDALGGEMAINADACAIQFRLLNRSKGPAVWSNRAQVDMDLYPRRLRRVCYEQSNLWLIEAEIKNLLVKRGRTIGVKTMLGQKIFAKTVVLTTGTFLDGLIHVSFSQYRAGRMGDPPTGNILSDQLRTLGFNMRRLKTGTCPRLDRRSLNLDKIPMQYGDRHPRMFSFLNKVPILPQICCWVTKTHERLHQLIRRNLYETPTYAGIITGVGTRYCPSIEDKIVRFPERESHHVFLEPQGLTSNLVYANGISTSLSLSIQIAMVRLLPGCERALIVRPGYAIEYDISDPLDLTADLQSKHLVGLFLAGQINGTSGYEEAAAQGLIAGINAARFSQGQKPFILNRSQAYIGVLIDDLITKGIVEPYRMFTSRAEYRLSLREDNADLRLTTLGRKLGLVNERRWAAFRCKRYALGKTWKFLKTVRVTPTISLNQRLAKLGDKTILHRPLSAVELLQRLGVTLTQVTELDSILSFFRGVSPEVVEQLLIKARYVVYEERECEQIAKFRARENMVIPLDMVFCDLPGLSREIQEKLAFIRPTNLGQAGRISGITPAAINVLSLHLMRLIRQGQE